MAPPKVKLTYFAARGWAEASRMILHYSGVPFEDKRVTMEEWPSFKASTPFGKMPVLEYNGQTLPESQAIARFLARKYGLAGKDDWEQAQVDSVADLYKDFGQKIRAYFNVAMGRGEGDKDALLKEFMEAFEEQMGHVENFLKTAKNGFLMPSGLTWIDFLAAELHDTLGNVIPDLYKNHHEIVKHSEKVHSLPQLQEYLQNRPKTIN
uniref:glutathione transferase n=1 Tax=Acrobeloides nanus TaxID=290746 RepID=A0A914DV08_9BILA